VCSSDLLVPGTAGPSPLVGFSGTFNRDADKSKTL